MLNGPVEAAMLVYSDFIHYKSGIYIRNSTELMGGHAIKIVGWCQDIVLNQNNENQTLQFFIGANSWDTVWGENGYFRI